MDERDKKLHRGIQLDDKFSKTVGRMEKSIDDLNSMLEEFRDLNHLPVATQVSQVRLIASDLQTIFEKIKLLREQNKI